MDFVAAQLLRTPSMLPQPVLPELDPAKVETTNYLLFYSHKITDKTVANFSTRLLVEWTRMLSNLSRYLA